jgi:hypothetical protein
MSQAHRTRNPRKPSFAKFAVLKTHGRGKITVEAMQDEKQQFVLPEHWLPRDFLQL